MDLPHHLSHPQSGGWPLADAATLWAWVRYGVTMTTPPSREGARLAVKARAEVTALAEYRPPATAAPTRRPSAWRGSGLGPPGWGLGSDDPPRRRAPTAPPRNWVRAEALAELLAQHGIPAPWAPAPAPAQAKPPRASVTQTRKESLARILEALRELDPALDLGALPGRKRDLLELCQAVAPGLFWVSPDVFDAALKGQAQFCPGRRATPYYMERAPAVRLKLGGS